MNKGITGQATDGINYKKPNKTQHIPDKQIAVKV